MEKTTEEKARAKLLKFGRKNKWNRAVAVLLLFFVMSFFHIRNYCHNNGKRFAVMLGTFFLFAVYSSFSFPAFITEDTGTDYELKNTDTQNISLAEEKEPDMAGLELLEDEDVLEQSDYNSTSHGYALVDKYDASDILQASEAIVSENVDAEKTGEDGSVTEDDNAEQEEFRSDDWRLVLINKQNSIPDDYVPARYHQRKDAVRQENSGRSAGYAGSGGRGRCESDHLLSIPGSGISTDVV